MKIRDREPLLFLVKKGEPPIEKNIARHRNAVWSEDGHQFRKRETAKLLLAPGSFNLYAPGGSGRNGNFTENILRRQPESPCGRLRGATIHQPTEQSTGGA